MNKFNTFIKNKRNIVLLAMLLLSIILFIPNAKIIINMEVEGSAESDLYYITPFYATFSLKNTFQVTNNQNIYTISSNVKMVKKIKLTFYNISDDFKIKIKDIKVSLPYIKGYSIDLKDINNKSYTKNNMPYINDGFVFGPIPILFIIMPILLFLIILLCIYMLFNKQITNSMIYSIPFIKNNLAIIGVLLFLILFEAMKIEGMHNSNFVSKMQSSIYIFKSDSYFLSLYIILFYITFKVKNKILSVIPLIIIFVITFIHVVDIALINLLSARLRFGEAAGFIPDISSIWKMTQSFIKNPAGIYAIILLIYTILFSLYIIFKKNHYEINKTHTLILTTLCIIFLPLFLINVGAKVYYNTALQDSIVRANMSKSEKVKYSQNKINNILNTFQLKYNCVNGLNTRKNVIIILIESLSSYKSQLFSGLDNKTPHIDSLGKDNSLIKEYYGNGFNSQFGLYSLLTGINYVTSNNIYGQKAYQDSIPSYFRTNGYKTVLYSGGDIIFGNTHIIAKKSGIDKLYDSVYNNVYNKNDMEYIFNSVDDTVLYNSILQWLKKDENKKQPFFMVIKTITTHQPYVDPATKEQSYDKTLEFADNAVNNFVTSLKENGYFDNGILVITSDHRAMLPISQQEYDRLGPLAHASIPLVVMDGGGHKEINGPFSHTDLGKSLEYLTLDKVCFNQFQHNIFNENKNSCAIYQQLINLALVDIKCGKSYGQVLLDGDNTRFIKDELNISDEYKKEIIDYINYLRVVE